MSKSPFKSSVAVFDKPAVGGLDVDEVKIATAIGGSTVLVLEDGNVLVGQMQPGKVRIERGKKDAQGRQAYTVEWMQMTANVTPLPPK